MIEKNRAEIWEVAKNLHEKVSCVMCDNISKLIDTVQPGLMEEKEKALAEEEYKTAKASVSFGI